MFDGAVAVVLSLRGSQMAVPAKAHMQETGFTFSWVFNVLWGTCSLQEEVLVAVGRAEALLPSLAVTTREHCSSAWSQSLRCIGTVQCS